jgi:hypothetical protein
VFDLAMVEHIVIQVPIDAKVTIFRCAQAGYVAVAAEMPFVAPPDDQFAALIVLDGRRLWSSARLLSGTRIEFEPSPDDPDELADYEDRRVRASS